MCVYAVYVNMTLRLSVWVYSCSYFSLLSEAIKIRAEEGGGGRCGGRGQNLIGLGVIFKFERRF